MILLAALAAAAFAYQLLALAAVLLHLGKRDPESGWTPPISVLKPVRGLDPRFAEAIRSHARQDYPEFEILFGIGEASDPAAPEIERLAAEFPALTIRLVHCRTRAPNGKAGVLEDLAAEARHPVLVVNDSDIHVPPGYLRGIVAPLEDPRHGVVTCLYRAAAASWPGRLEASGIATDFAPSVLVARLFGVSEFGLGSTLAVRSDDLNRIGGFASVRDFLADDYQLSRHICGLGRRVVLSRVVVETSLSDASWADVWRHQVRWARTIRVSRGGGYLGLPLANATLWSLALAGAGHAVPALALLGVRLIVGFVSARFVLHDPRALKDAPLMPLRDLFGFGIWAAGLFGTTVVWRGRRMGLRSDGRIVEPGAASETAAAEPSD